MKKSTGLGQPLAEKLLTLKEVAHANVITNLKSVATLKLPETDAEKFLKALQFYDQERSAAFLRRCAYALIKHHEKNEQLNTPLAFQLGQQIDPAGTALLKSASAKRLPPKIQIQS